MVIRFGGPNMPNLTPSNLINDNNSRKRVEEHNCRKPCNRPFDSQIILLPKEWRYFVSFLHNMLDHCGPIIQLLPIKLKKIMNFLFSSGLFLYLCTQICDQ